MIVCMGNMIKRQKGISLINIILFLCIIICCVIIFWIFNNGQTDLDILGEVKEKSNVIKYDTTEENIKRNIVINSGSSSEDTNTMSNVTLNNSILIGNNYEENNQNEGKRFYYRQLNSIQKSMYDSIVNNIDKFVNGYEAIELDTNDSKAGDYFQTVWDAISLDRPDLFWIDTSKVSLVTTTTSLWGRTKYKYTIEPKDGASYFLDYYNNTSEVKEARRTLQSISDNIVQRANGSIKDKIKFVHDELVNRIEYNQVTHVNNANIYGALIQNKCVCEGYAEAFKFLLDKLDIPCVIIYGEGINESGEGEAHAWNYVKMEDDNWYAIDATWDDPIIIGNGYLSESRRYKYFLRGSENFLSTHYEDRDVSKTGQNFAYPALSKYDYKN